ncbi:unnamed protein product [Brachionus calyciflorus]|uniref:RanBP2-type domain-containing protein n=1 Tax=Brachionus calyciflorus TaxID=104777 RepID=A0A814GV65_9BILA|nr:unnamed protein product [Brachionus calyciflorus]
MEGSVMVVKNILEDLIRKCFASQYFKTGDGLAREVGRNIRMPVKFETGEQTRDGCKGAENLAGWKWIPAIVQLWTKICIGNWSKSCGDHVERCMEVRRINYWHERQTNDTKQCLFCKKWVKMFELDDHLEECRWRDSVKCGLRIEKLEEDAHLNECETTVVSLIACPMCPQRLEAYELEHHWLICVGRKRRCKLCGEREDPGHNCFECPFCIEKKPVKYWVVFGRIGHFVCRGCSRRFERCDNASTVMVEEWQCEMCTYLNEDTFYECQICQTPKIRN